MWHSSLYRWYESHRRELPWRETSDPYKIWLSEVILQQTRVAQGMEYYLRFTSHWPDVRQLAEAKEDAVLREWQGLGYYSRARNLHRAAQQIVAEYNQPDGRVLFPDTFEGLRRLPGVGDYTAGAIASFAYDLPYPAIDGNVLRVLARLNDCDTPIDSTAGKKEFRQMAIDMMDTAHPRLFNSAIMELGALQCTPQNPECESCPLKLRCQAYAHGTVALLPIHKQRPPLHDRWLNYSIYIDPSGKTLIHKREGNDIWHHLWEFPLEEREELVTDERADRALDYTHILSHQRLHARFLIYKVDVLPAVADTIAVGLDELDDYAFSRLSLRAMQDLGL
ncbi:MAG: A/G-specific adenine glycosylase [Paludibacteraceae bacterium]|nr:A/G-specific adenine glycosylase [Paludibacteraceae bacterium]